MRTLTLLKDIFVRPRDVFQKETLEASLMEVFYIYLGLGLVPLLLNPFLLAHNPGFQGLIRKYPSLGAHTGIVAIIGFSLSLAFIYLQMRVVRWLLRLRKIDPSLNSLLAMAFLMQIIFLPFGWLASILSRGWIGLLFVGLKAGLMVYGISLLIESKPLIWLWIYIFSYLLTALGLFILMLVSGVLLLLFRALHR